MATVAKRATQGGVLGAVNNIKNWPNRLRGYVDALRREMRLVKWPAKKQVRATTVVVLAAVFAFALFFGVVDYLLTIWQTKLYQYFTQ